MSLAKRVTTMEAQTSTLNIKASEVPPDTKDCKTIWINLRNGSVKPITLRQVNGRWIGEQNEYYSDFPTQRTLEKLYAY
jgi:hypothetical protein